MKKYLYSFALLVLISAITSCTTYKSNYYGYSNNPQVQKPNNTNVANNTATSNQSPNDDEWVNPLSGNKASTGNASEENSVYMPENGNVTVNNYYGNGYGSSYAMNSVHYVPVVVPWWNDYYGWSTYSRHRGWRMSVSFGSYCGYDWYSPWYRYNPYYGHSWSSWNNWGYYHNWYHQPVYSYHNGYIPKNSYRNFGKRNNNYNIPNSRSNVNKVNYIDSRNNSSNPRSVYNSNSRTSNIRTSSTDANTGNSRSSIYSRTVKENSRSDVYVPNSKETVNSRNANYDSPSQKENNSINTRNSNRINEPVYTPNNARTGDESNSGNVYRNDNPAPKNTENSRTFGKSSTNMSPSPQGNTNVSSPPASSGNSRSTSTPSPSNSNSGSSGGSTNTRSGRR